MKTLKHRQKQHDIGMYDSATGKDLKTIRAVDVTDECPPSGDKLILLYTKAVRGEIVQIRHGCARTHYFTERIHREDNEHSAMDNFAVWVKTTRAHLIELFRKNSPSLANAIGEAQPPAKKL